MCTHGGSSFPRVIRLFGQGHRVSRTPSQIIIPRSGSLFLIPDPRSSFRILVPRSGSSFLVPDPRSSFRILVPRSGSSFLVPRSRSSFLVPDLTYRFITMFQPKRLLLGEADITEDRPSESRICMTCSI